MCFAESRSWWIPVLMFHAVNCLPMFFLLIVIKSQSNYTPTSCPLITFVICQSALGPCISLQRSYWSSWSNRVFLMCQLIFLAKLLLVQRGAHFSLKKYLLFLSLRPKDFQTRLESELAAINKQCSFEPTQPSSLAKLRF